MEIPLTRSSVCRSHINKYSSAKVRNGHTYHTLRIQGSLWSAIGDSACMFLGLDGTHRKIYGSYQLSVALHSISTHVVPFDWPSDTPSRYHYREAFQSCWELSSYRLDVLCKELFLGLKTRFLYFYTSVTLLLLVSTSYACLLFSTCPV